MIRTKLVQLRLSHSRNDLMASTRPGGALCFAFYVNVASVDRVGTRTFAVQSEIMSYTVFSLIKEGTIERGLQVVTIL